MNNSRRCDNFNFDVHRASYAKHMRSKKHLENDKQNELIIPKWFFLNLLKITLGRYIIVNH